MRVTSELFAAALVRRVFGEGGFATILRKGAAEAGAIFIAVRSRDGSFRLLGPAPQSGYQGERPESRQFVVLAQDIEEAALSERIARETRFDTDVWFLELETPRALEDLVDVMTP